MQDDAQEAFKRAAAEIDSLSLEGYFGIDVRRAVEQRDSMPISEYLGLIIENWLRTENQYGKVQVLQLIFLFFRMYTEAIRVAGQTAVDSLTWFYKGFPGNPESECLSSYTQLAVSRTELRRITREIQGLADVEVSHRMRLAQAILTFYQKGVEFVNKMLTILIALLELSGGKIPKPERISAMRLADKIARFERLSKGAYEPISGSVEREIRNAESHLDMRYDPSSGEFLYKVIRKRRVVLKQVSVERMMLDVLPKIVWVVQGFIFSCCLLVLAGTDRKTYQRLTERILQGRSKARD